MTSGWDGKLRVFSAKTLKPLAILQYHAQQATTVAFSPDSTRMASAGRWAVLLERQPPCFWLQDRLASNCLISARMSCRGLTLVYRIHLLPARRDNAIALWSVFSPKGKV